MRYSRAFQVRDLGVLDYEQVYRQQKALLQQKKQQDVIDTLLLVEHPDVYTYGRKNPPPQQIPGSFAIERGGEATFHNIGQLVCYPILTLKLRERDLHAYLRRLENTLILVLGEFGLIGCRKEGATGVWLKGGERKIASIGVAVSSWVTYHGSALNVSNDLSGFGAIEPCGFSSQVMTSMKEELKGNCPSLTEVKEAYISYFSEQFERSLLI